LHDAISWKSEAIFVEIGGHRDQPGNHDSDEKFDRSNLLPPAPATSESFSQLDEDAPVARILDFAKGDDESQPFDDI
jgi:hypothetical protein